MADSPDDTHGTDPTLRIGGWLPESRHHEAPPPYPSTVARDGRHRAEPPIAPMAGRPAPGRRSDPAPRGPGRTLVLACVAVGVLATLVFALSPFWSGPDPAEDRAPPTAPSTGEADPEVVGLASPTPNVMFSPAPVSLSTRAALPTRTPAPTHRPSSPTTRPSPSTAPPKPPVTQSPVAQPRADELQPLPPSQEPALRSSGGGPETFIDFVNARGSQVVVYWLDYGGQRQRYAVLEAGQGYRQQTYVGHPWVVTDAGGNGLVCFLPAPEIKKAIVR